MVSYPLIHKHTHFGSGSMVSCTQDLAPVGSKGTGSYNHSKVPVEYAGLND